MEDSEFSGTEAEDPNYIYRYYDEKEEVEGVGAIFNKKRDKKDKKKGAFFTKLKDASGFQNVVRQPYYATSKGKPLSVQ